MPNERILYVKELAKSSLIKDEQSTREEEWKAAVYPLVGFEDAA